MDAIDNLHTVVEPIIKEAGALVRSFFRQPSVNWKRKKNSGLVTQADHESEEYLISALKKIDSNVSFIGEETGVQGKNDYCWVIDPIDGTGNFINKIPYFCISVALTHYGTPIFGAIYQPITDEYFYAYQAKGAYLNGSPISVSSEKKSEQSIFIVGSPGVAINRRSLSSILRKESAYEHSFISYRYFGSAALDQANLAAGRLEGLYFRYLEWWDIAAGMLLIQEAGGIVSDFRGDKKSPEGDHSYLAGNPLLYNALHTIIKK